MSGDADCNSISHTLKLFEHGEDQFFNSSLKIRMEMNIWIIEEQYVEFGFVQSVEKVKNFGRKSDHF